MLMMSSTGLIPLDLSRKRKLSDSKSPNSFLKEGWIPRPEPFSDSDKTDESAEDSDFNCNKDPSQSQFVQQLPLRGWDEVVDLSVKSPVDMKVSCSRYRNGGKDSSSGSRRKDEPFLPCGLEPALNDCGQFVCMFCPKTFVHKYPYRDHIKTHTGRYNI
ncbi:unnamed protein product [Allacma fusca]|uniref:C2H2-type domain-containing protein n=1 Tax=Allacma fusca TaxID=39272 RepID=A0A8J2JU94_9HEXA|nr:unnamed protein product [Allacma fusca]